MANLGEQRVAEQTEQELEQAEHEQAERELLEMNGLRGQYIESLNSYPFAHGYNQQLIYDGITWDIVLKEFNEVEMIVADAEIANIVVYIKYRSADGSHINYDEEVVVIDIYMKREDEDFETVIAIDNEDYEEYEKIEELSRKIGFLKRVKKANEENEKKTKKQMYIDRIAQNDLMDKSLLPTMRDIFMMIGTSDNEMVIQLKQQISTTNEHMNDVKNDLLFGYRDLFPFWQQEIMSQEWVSQLERRITKEKTRENMINVMDELVYGPRSFYPFWKNNIQSEVWINQIKGSDWDRVQMCY